MLNLLFFELPIQATPQIFEHYLARLARAEL